MDNSLILNREQAREQLRSADKPFYVYVLCRPDGTPFYVGEGTGGRAFQHEADAWNEANKSHKLNLIRHLRQNGHELRYIIDSHFTLKKDALNREKELITQIGRHDLGLGPLTNQNDGGGGASNPSAEVRAKRSESLGGNDAEDVERRVANTFLNSIAGKQDSVPIKAWLSFRTRAHLLRPSPEKPKPRPKPRMAKAIVASAIANNLLLEVGCVIPRRLVVDGVDFVIENGCGGDMIHAGVVEQIEPRTEPLEEKLRLTETGFQAVVAFIGRSHLIDLGVLTPEGD